MFDGSLPEPGPLRLASDAAVLAAIEGGAQVEAAAAARRLDAIGALTDSALCYTNPTSPTGRAYITHPGSRPFVPHWPAAELSGSAVADPARGLSPASGRCPQMPTRRRARAAERDLNDTHVAERNKPSVPSQRF